MGEVRELKINAPKEISPQLPIKHKNKYCLHSHVEVDEDERCLRCIKCNSFIDTYEYILSLAREERNFFWQLAAIQNKISEAKIEKEQLLKDIIDLKSAKRKLLKENR